MKGENQNDKLDAMLRYRRITAANPGLAQRIILKAQVSRKFSQNNLSHRRGNP